MPRARTVCSKPGCANLTQGGRCTDCRRTAEQARGSAAARGYDRDHRENFRKPVLRRDPVCVVCQAKPSRHADHWPLDRDELVRRGLDPNDPAHGRGLCHGCHSTETATNQPGGWNT